MPDNPFEPSSSVDEPPAPRLWFLLTAIGAWLAAAWWALLTLLIAVGAMAGQTSGLQLLAPLLLIGMYGYRGAQVFSGEVGPARNLVILHGIGAVISVITMASGGFLVGVMQGIKLVIHVFGGACAWMVRRSAAVD